MIQIAVFASGAGSNAQKLIEYFRGHAQIRIALIVCNKPGAGILQIAAKEQIPTLLIEKKRFFEEDAYASAFNAAKIDFIVLAGFLWKVPAALINAYPQCIVNIHPALLPKFGGKGMYGHFVHEAVIAAGEKQSGISIHYIDEVYDHGNIIFQASCEIAAGETPDTLAKKIQLLEHAHYAPVIERIAQLQNQR